MGLMFEENKRIGMGRQKLQGFGTLHKGDLFTNTL
jgi:hypothetical protein